MQHPEGRLGHQGAAVLAHAAQRLGDPYRVAGEQLVVLGRAQEADDPPFDHHVVDELLRLLLGQLAGAQVALDVNVPEGRQPAGRHCRAVLLLDGSEIAEIGPLHGFARRRGRPRNVVAVVRRHLLQFLERADLLGKFLAQTDHVLGRMAVIELVPLTLLVGDQEIHAVQCDPTIVANDAAAPVGIGQAGDDVRRPRLADVRRIGVEHAVVVGLAVLGEDFAQERIGLVAVGFEAVCHHAPAAERHDRPLERRLGLQPDDQFVRLVDVAGRVRQDAGRHLRDVEDAFFPLLHEQRLQGLPDAARTVGGPLQEGGVALVRRVIALDELAHVNSILPASRREAAPRGDVVLIAGSFQLGCHGLLLGLIMESPARAGPFLLAMPGFNAPFECGHRGICCAFGREPSAI